MGFYYVNLNYSYENLLAGMFKNVLFGDKNVVFMAWRQLNVRYTCYKTQKHANSPQAQKIENCIVLVDIFIKMSSNTTMTSYFFPTKKVCQPRSLFYMENGNFVLFENQKLLASSAK